MSAQRVINRLVDLDDVDGSGQVTGDVLTWNSSTGKYENTAPSAGSPGGSTGDVQYNSAGAFAALPGWNYSSSKTTVTAQAAGTTPLVVKAAASQSVNILEIQNSSATAISGIASNGVLVAPLTNPAIRATTGNGYISFYTDGTQVIMGGNSITMLADASVQSLAAYAGDNATRNIGSYPYGPFASIWAKTGLFFVPKTSGQCKYAASLVPSWVVSTEASRTGRMVITVGDYNSTGREVIRVEADGSNAMLGFYGATAVAKQTSVPVTAADIHAALVNLGLIT